MCFDGYWWWVADSDQSTSAQEFALWCVYSGPLGTGLLIPDSSVKSGPLTAGQWNYVPLPEPIPLSIGATYIAAAGVNGSFPNTDNQFGSGDPYGDGIIAGPLVGYSDASGSFPSPFLTSQGVFSTDGSDPTLLMPTDGSQEANFWIDVQVSTAPAGASYRLWPGYPRIPGQPGIDTGEQTMGTQFLLSQACMLNNIWFYSPPGVAVLPSRCAI